MRIGIDITGSDFGIEQVLSGVIQVLPELAHDAILVLYGPAEEAKKILSQKSVDLTHIEFIDCDEVIEMGEHPAKAFLKKPNSSIAKAFKDLSIEKIDAFASAGNTGAMMVGSVMEIKPIPGVMRPAIVSFVPKDNGGTGVILDVGANAEVKPEVLQQFAVLGKIYAEAVLKIENPRVGLINIGGEAEKGSILYQNAHKLLQDSPNLNFIGNTEGYHIFKDIADVMVCDGFVGNVILKLSESFYRILHKKGFMDGFTERFNYEIYGGSPVVGVSKPVVIAHGNSSALAIKNMVLQAIGMVEGELCKKIQTAIN